MFISVIIPSYNHAPFLKKRIESVLDQTYEYFEVILLDDYSVDNSREIIESYRHHKKISHVVYNDCNSGSTFKQWKKGIELAKGDWIWIAESDDWCEINFLECLVAGVKTNQECVLGFCQSYWIDEKNHIKFVSTHSTDAEYLSGSFFLENRLVYGCTIYNASMAIFKRESALKIGNDFTTFRMCGDWLFWLTLVRHGDVYITNTPLNYFRKHPNNVSNNSDSTGQNFIEEIRILKLLKGKRDIPDNILLRVAYIKYNNFKKRKNRLSVESQYHIKKAFYNLFENRALFYFFLLFMKTKTYQTRINNKLRLNS